MESYKDIEIVKRTIEDNFNTVDEVHRVEPLIKDILSGSLLLYKVNPDDNSTIQLSTEEAVAELKQTC
jgi:hypothetical protein